MKKFKQRFISREGQAQWWGLFLKGLTKDSWVTRIRPPSARVAVRGSTMPPKMRIPVKKTFGKGVKALDESERREDLASNHHFDSRLVELFQSGGELSGEGRNVCRMLAHQLKALPVHMTIQYSNPKYISYAVKMMDYLFYTEMSRPGQIALSYVKNSDIPPKSLRFKITRYDPTKGNR